MPLCPLHAPLQTGLQGSLDIRVDRGVNPKTTRCQCILAHDSADLVRDPLIKMTRSSLQGLGIQLQRRRGKRLCFTTSQRPEVHHPPQNQIPGNPVARGIVQR
ncbi:MAG: hypothetical protein EAZ65_02790 [Verrucomicrobia bacterium]|nr:MAG: hypothetical protein EAZ65_02790 [Verrucomicrobiota bacterium]